MPTLAPPITAIPDFPALADRTTYNAKAFAWATSLKTATAPELAALGTNIYNNAVEVATSAATLSTKASEASTSASTATTQASASSVSAAASEASRIAGSKLNLGSKTSDPALDNQGSPLLTGALYFNTTSNGTRIYNGVSWQTAAGVVSPNFSILRETQTARAGQTVFNLLNSYIVGTNAIMVYINGVRQFSDAYVETNSTTITFTGPLSVGDSVLFEAGVTAVGTNVAAGNVTFSPAGGVVATNAQAAIAELGARNAVNTLNGLTGNVALKTINGGSLLGGGDLALGASLLRSARTANTALGTADKSKLIDITSGTFTQTFDAAATLGSGWFVYLRNSGSGDITLDPNSSELIDGLTSYVMYPGEVRLVQCDGVAFTSVVLSAFYRAFTASGTFTKPPGYFQFDSLVWSAGASGGKASGAMRGGGGGGCFPFTALASTYGATETITIGAGGTSVTSNGTGGETGGDTTIGALAKVLGGSSTAGGHVGTNVFAGILLTSVGQPGVGFEGAVANTSLAINTVWGGATGPNDGSVIPGHSIYGGAAGGGHNGTTARVGGNSMLGGNGGAASVSNNATAGAAPGGGGGAAKNDIGNSGAGARGEVRIRGII